MACAVEDFAARRNHARHHPSRASSLPITSRVVVAMDSVVSVSLQTSRGFFEHVIKRQVDMKQRHAFLQVEHVASHGVYVSYASQIEVRVMEIHTHISKDGGGCFHCSVSSAVPSDAHGSPRQGWHATRLKGLAARRLTTA